MATAKSTSATLNIDTVENLQQALEAVGDPIAFLRAPKQWERIEPRQYEAAQIVPQVPPEFSNWQREQRAWRETVAVFDQSHHMNGLYLSGPDSLRFLSRLAANELETSTPGRAHQIITCNYDGYLIGDGILFHLAPGELFMCGAPYAVNWVRYNAEKADLDIEVTYEPRSPVYANGYGNTRRNCRYQIQGPNAWALIEKLNGGPVGDVKFFHMTELTIAGHRVHGLRHGMAGAPGLEIWAPWELRSEIRAAMADAGREFGVAFVGSMAYLSSAIEGGWIASAMPAVYTGEALKPYREWLPADELEMLLRLAGSYRSENIEDYYVTPYDLGYERFVDLEHEFVGRDALAEQDPANARIPVSVVWNAADTAKLIQDMLDPDGSGYRPLHLPVCGYGGWETVSEYEAVTRGGELVGFGHNTAYTVNEHAIITLCTVARSVDVGSEVVLHWGDAGGGFGDRVTDGDPMTTIRGIVGPAPYSRVARTEHRA